MPNGANLSVSAKMFIFNRIQAIDSRWLAHAKIVVGGFTAGLVVFNHLHFAEVAVRNLAGGG
jgi:hypothetical protein